MVSASVCYPFVTCIESIPHPSQDVFDVPLIDHTIQLTLASGKEALGRRGPLVWSAQTVCKGQRPATQGLCGYATGLISTPSPLFSFVVTTIVWNGCIRGPRYRTGPFCLPIFKPIPSLAGSATHHSERSSHSNTWSRSCLNALLAGELPAFLD